MFELLMQQRVKLLNLIMSQKIIEQSITLKFLDYAHNLQLNIYQTIILFNHYYQYERI